MVHKLFIVFEMNNNVSSNRTERVTAYIYAQNLEFIVSNNIIYCLDNNEFITSAGHLFIVFFLTANIPMELPLQTYLKLKFKHSCVRKIFSATFILHPTL